MYHTILLLKDNHASRAVNGVAVRQGPWAEPIEYEQHASTNAKHEATNENIVKSKPWS